ncbi:hypothetical protein KY339_05915 [Candidatus Woesearchaeota archaeon]|nr:hypothetical protein [Candidatus Woesearchaeota archaeon]
MSKLKKLIKNWRVILLLVFLVIALASINHNPWKEGIAIRSVLKNSSAAIAGIENPSPTTSLTEREVILNINGQPIKTVQDYYEFESALTMDDINSSVQLRTNKGYYKLIVKPLTEKIILNETVEKTINETVQVNKTINGTTVLVNETVEKTIEVPKKKTNILGVDSLGLRVYEAPKNNIKKGLDLTGGTRVLLEPEEELSTNDMEMLLSNMKERLNVFGLTDIIVRKTTDLRGNQFVLVEVAGANEEEVRDLLAKQGKFEAKVGNETVFIGGKDITYVCRTAECSGIDPQYGCGAAEGGQLCRFRFTIALSPEAAQKQADTTQNLEVVTKNGQQYLSKQLDLYLDDQLVDSLNIAADLKGQPATDIAISGSGFGTSRQAAVLDTMSNMKRLQTILITGSLPVKLNIVKTDAISPLLGKEFTRNAIIIGLLAILSVGVVIFFRYRKLQIALPMMFTMVSEVVLLLGLAALIRWNLDLAAIAGIIIAAGTGVDHQIVIVDEVLKGESSVAYSWKERVKRAFFIIMAAYFTTVVAMIPLLFAGAGLLKGFAFTTIAGVSFGVFLTRPAFAAITEILLRRE